MRIVYRGTEDYPTARLISNARIGYQPAAIAYCASEADVIEALRRARAESKGGIRVRAGGHQHEGMCSGDDSWIIDVSLLNTIEVDPDANTVTVGPGAKLGDIYDTVLPHGLLFPGGACRDVHVGGLVQGGGWGLFTRAVGLTCDSLHKFRMVMHDFTAIEVKGESADPNHDLFWAVSGGGGGNFGVMTKIVFKVVPYKFAPGPGPKSITQFSANFADRGRMAAVLEDWLRNFPNDDEYRLTTFCRLIAPGTEATDKPSLILGNFIGERAELETNLKRLLPNTFGDAEIKYTEVAMWPPHPTPLKNIFTPTEYQAGPPQGDGVDLSDTCSGAYFRHKVSSAYPLERFGAGGPEEILRHINTTSLGNARRYISLHSLGGVAKGEETNREQWSCFAYRHKPYIIQYQAWWNDPQLDAQCLDWLKSFRDAMDPHTEGAFINFPDRDRVATTHRVKLMAPYYGGNFTRLRTIKSRYDPNDVFDFPMGIPGA